MKTTKPSWRVDKFERLASSGELRFDYPIQRASGQWDALQKSLLIHSIVGDFPIPPVAIVEAELDGKGGEFVIDGKQRLTTVLDYLSGVKDEEGKYPSSAYKLHEETPSVEVEEVGEPVELSDKYFDELPEDIQTKFLKSTFQIQRIENATDEEIEELFSRWNNGTPLTKQQKARGKMGVANATIVDALQKHPFLTEKSSFTSLQRRRSDDEAVVLQSMMLLSEMEIESFVADKLLQYAKDMRDNDITEVSNGLKTALDYANEAIKGTSPLLKKLHLPTLLLVAKKAHDENVEPQVFGAWVEDFNNAINGRTRDKALVKTNYKNYTGAGSVKRDKVLGRKNAMITHFNEFIDRYEPQIIEEDDLNGGDNNAEVFTVDELLDSVDSNKDKIEDEIDVIFEGLDEVLKDKEKVKLN